jgi:antitoxin (DNA-binding transcriptional repressor) of toxin-antitoxin stability system
LVVVLVPPDLGAEVGLDFPELSTGQRVYSPQDVPEVPVDEIPGRVRQELAPLLGRIKPRERVAITAGSRGIANIVAILRTCGEAIRDQGGEPFIIPAMGSHGGATADGQHDMLAGYGITHETVGMPLISSMDVQQIGAIDEMPVFFSTTALEADHILLVNRVKPHTDFRGPVESGLAKICAIGLGKQRGAQTIHSYGTRGLAELMPRAARCIVDQTGKVLGGLAILENAYDHTASVRCVQPDGIAAEAEQALQRQAKQLMGALPFDALDVLIVDEMGKNVSGTGMDTNVLGRMFVPGVPEEDRPRITTVVVLDLTEESHGNAIGIGLADFTTERVVSRIDWQATYMNGYTAGLSGLLRNRLPSVLANDRAAIATAIRMCGQPDLSRLRLARIKNTLQVACVEFSPSLREEADAAHVEVTGPARPMQFDAAGRLL